jgi:hypothetical protein
MNEAGQDCRSVDLSIECYLESGQPVDSCLDISSALGAMVFAQRGWMAVVVVATASAAAAAAALVVRMVRMALFRR